MNIEQIDIDLIVPNREQPRTKFDKGKLEELKRSIERNGIIQPILVKKEGGLYRIVAGERRWRAAMGLGISTIPVIVRDLEKNQEMELSIVENIQREDLGAIEEARALKRYLDENKCTQEQLSKILGKSRSYVANTIRLLKLPEKLIDYIEEGSISSGHGRILVPIDDRKIQARLAERSIDENLSVRELEREVSKIKTQLAKEGSFKGNPTKKDEKDIFLKDAEDSISRSIGMKVNIVNSKKKKKLEIEYKSDEDLERVMKMLLDSK